MYTHPKMRELYAYSISLITMLSVMFIPSVFMSKSVKSPWYKCIRPDITPPNYVFPIVWTFLYLCIGIGLAKTLLQNNSYERNILLGLYAWNLVLNVLWSFVYFGMHDTVFALFILFNVIISAVFVLYYTYRLLPLWVFWLLLPYLAWLYFASLLNFLSILKTCN